MEAQEASNARRPEKTFIATRPDTASRGEQESASDARENSRRVRLDPEAHPGYSSGEGEHAPPQAPRRPARPELRRAFRFEPHPQGAVLRQGEKRGCGDEQRVPVADARVWTDGKIVQKRKKEIARPIERHAADHVSQRRAGRGMEPDILA
jgi:hypothetical protein